MDSIENKCLTPEDGLSARTLEALVEFFQSEGLQETDKDVEKHPNGGHSLCEAFTKNDMDVISSTVARLQLAHNLEKMRTKQAMESCKVSDLLTESEENAIHSLERDGFFRFDEVLSADSCCHCLATINSQLSEAVRDGTDFYSEVETTGFGNVYSRDHRWDMYLQNEGTFAKSLVEMFADTNCALHRFFHALFLTEDSKLFEFSALVSDNGASSQPIHPDTQYRPQCPLYTVFVALQDVEADMGPTIFLPGTHTAEAHARLFDPAKKDEFLGGCEYKQALLKRGDAVVMDSRTMHYGDANWRGRRVLLYFTFHNPRYCGNDLPTGSMFPDLSLSLCDLSRALSPDEHQGVAQPLGPHASPSFHPDPPSPSP